MINVVRHRLGQRFAQWGQPVNCNAGLGALLKRQRELATVRGDLGILFIRTGLGIGFRRKPELLSLTVFEADNAPMIFATRGIRVPDFVKKGSSTGHRLASRL